MSSIEVNGRTYRLPEQPAVVVCVDGWDPEYVSQAVARDYMPWMKRTLAAGAAVIADCVIPSFTNPNNLSIVTGVPPAVHGICGNFLYDPQSGTEVMMNDPKWLRAPTILAALADAGRKVAVVTAKDKLRKSARPQDARRVLLRGKSRRASPWPSTASKTSLKLVGLPLPGVYSAALSEFVFAAGVRLMQKQRPDLMYLSTTDYVQHKHAPGAPEANAFCRMMDGYLEKLERSGAAIVLTADHGMSAKTRLDASPNVIYLQDVLDGWLGAGRTRVILPITDPYVVHHGALGSYATVYLTDPAQTGSLAERIAALRGIELVLTRTEAAHRFELPADRIGDLVVVSARSVTLGSAAAKHDLSGLDAPLRSHGGLSEQPVPLVMNRRIANLDTNRRWRNFDAFDWVLNHGG